MKHTPGPWSCMKGNVISDQIAASEKGRLIFVASVGAVGSIRGDADARLVASAPELIEALEAFVKEREEEILALGYESVEAYGKLVKPEEAYAIAKRAIKKAKGE